MKGPHNYRSIADALRGQIRSGQYLPGAFLPTESELQRCFGVSRSTIRRALAALAGSGWAEVKPKRGVAAKYGPTAELSGSVAYVDYADLVNERVFFGISRALHGTGLHLTHIDSRTYGDEGALEYAGENGFLAAFIWSKEGFPSLDRIAEVQKTMPVIALDHRMAGVLCDVVAEDNQAGAAAIVRHLALQGRKRIAVSGMMDMLDVNHERFSGYLQGLFQSGLLPHPIDFQFCRSSGGGPEETSMFAQRLEHPDRPDAVFVMQDMCVPEVVETILSAGLRIPEDIAVAAFGGEVPIRIEDVGLTSMVVDWAEFAEECVRVLIERLQSPARVQVHVTVPTRLVVRGSCGAPKELWDQLPDSDFEIRLGGRRLVKSLSR